MDESPAAENDPGQFQFGLGRVFLIMTLAAVAFAALAGHLGELAQMSAAIIVYPALLVVCLALPFVILHMGLFATGHAICRAAIWLFARRGDDRVEGTVVQDTVVQDTVVQDDVVQDDVVQDDVAAQDRD